MECKVSLHRRDDSRPIIGYTGQAPPRSMFLSPPAAISTGDGGGGAAAAPPRWRRSVSFGFDGSFAAAAAAAGRRAQSLWAAATPGGGDGSGGNIGGGGKVTGDADGPGGEADDDDDDAMGAAAAALAAQKLTAVALPRDMQVALAKCALSPQDIAKYAKVIRMPVLGGLARTWRPLRERLMGSDRLLFTLVAEEAIGLAAKTGAEIEARKDKFWQEFDFVISDLALEVRDIS